MLRENIGECGIGQMPGDRDWIIVQLELGICYLKAVLGPPPKRCKLEVIWHEHELGDYPSIGLTWNQGELGERERNYIARCDVALSIFNEAVDWSAIDISNVEIKLKQVA